ncbi:MULTISPECIES: carbohydrate ABC transporter permease [unclassified Dietzia]|uniref:carbohydrate ABC transporter permease n=1 Tax=unclassified Dietzia TaxID=2617939 RepID=UPI00131610A8|nr:MULTISPECIES: carbohydrate ABC transporter permease [unclassified Dietzia]QGW26513.1 ABC transport system, permease component [Dietzia sp. DQ12-45-1b]
MSHRAPDQSTSSLTRSTTSSSSRSGAHDRDRADDLRPPRKPLGPRIGTYVGALLILIWGLAPFYWMLVTAFRDNRFVFSASPVPSHLTLDNFREALATDAGNNFFGAIINSVIISSITTALALLFGVFTAYALARVDFRGKFLVTGVILAASMFPGVALVTPLFQLFTDIGWIGTYQALIIPNISFALPLTIYTLTSFFNDLPWELEEAARVDGATRGQAFIKIILPLAAPALFTTAILAFIITWNEFLLSQQLSNSSTEPVTVAIARFSGVNPYIPPHAAIMAAGALVTVPLVIMVLIFQRRIISGLTAGGLKS